MVINLYFFILLVPFCDYNYVIYLQPDIYTLYVIYLQPDMLFLKTLDKAMQYDWTGNGDWLLDYFLTSREEYFSYI